MTANMKRVILVRGEKQKLHTYSSRPSGIHSIMNTQNPGRYIE